MAQAKHYLGYDMTGYKTIVDAQALHEIYLAPFLGRRSTPVCPRSCAPTTGSMASSAVATRPLLNDVLRGELGFKGFVTSDWARRIHRSTSWTGLDMEMPGLMPPGSPVADDHTILLR